MRRKVRRVRARIAGPRVGVVYHTAYAWPDNPIADARRAARVLDHVLGEGWLVPADVRVPPAIGLGALRRVHDDAYLESLDTPSAIARALGEAEPPPLAIAEGYLRAQRWATAGTVHAAGLALSGAGVVVNLGGGFHHAERGKGGGFCLLHDVAIALEEVRARGFSGRALILALDLHQGDGTRTIFRDDPRVVCASIHATAWDEEPSANTIDMALGPGVGDATYLAAVRRMVDQAFAAAEPQIVFYVAGVDVAIDDALGGWRVSADAIAERDRIVLERCRGLATVMVTAGGYGPDAWRHTARTLVWLLSGEDRSLQDTPALELRAFRRIARELGESELSAGPADDFGITEADVLGDLIDKRRPDLLLGFYTTFGVELAFERYGLSDLLRRRGYPCFKIELDVRSGSGEAITVRTDDARRLVLLELVVREALDVAPFRLLSIEWLMLQDPTARPTPERPLLPGQQHPGLGGLRIVFGMVTMAAQRLGFDGLTFVPAHYHTASQARALLRFLEPADEALFVAMKGALGARSLIEASPLVDAGRIVDARAGKPVPWRPARMVAPLSAALRDRVQGPTYDRQVEEAAARLELSLAAR
ncbi:MAG: histone deacetylase [Polyangiaceae bacterium]